MVNRSAPSRFRRALVAATLAGLLLVAAIAAAWSPAATAAPAVRAQQASSPTPVPLQFPTATATAGLPTETPTRTPTSVGRPWVEALAAETNVRAGPDINEARLGQIAPGTPYTVLGKRFQWYWIEYPEAPGGSGWVHESVVALSGDAAQIPNLEEIPTTAPELAEAQQTQAALTLTPGLGATLTAQALITPTGLFTPQEGEPATLQPGQPLPTFTYPPYTVTPVIIPRQNPPASPDGGLAPIIPILILGALGMMGMLVSLLRRL